MRTHHREQHHLAQFDGALSGSSIAAPRLSSSGRSRRPSVLVVDGAEPAFRLLRLARDQIAHRCLIIYVEQRAACVVLDLDIHGPSALEVCRGIRAQPDANDTTILLMTAQRSVSAFDAALLAGADDVLLKPMADAELLERVEEAFKPVRYTGAELRRRCERLRQQRAELATGATHRASLAG